MRNSESERCEERRQEWHAHCDRHAAYRLLLNLGRPLSVLAHLTRDEVAMLATICRNVRARQMAASPKETVH